MLKTLAPTDYRTRPENAQVSRGRAGLNRRTGVDRPDEFDRLGARSHSVPMSTGEPLCAFVCILKDYRRVEDLLLAFVDHGIPGATVLEGRGMGQIVGGEMPAFAGARGAFPGSAADSQIVFSVMSAEQAAFCLKLANHLAGPLEEPGRGVAFVLPVSAALGVLAR